jgi:GAF domain-containing protein
VCAAAATSLDVSGAWVIAGDGINPGQAMCATDVVSESLAEVQITLGEGPCHDAAVSGVPVLAANLADGTGHWWAVFGEVAGRAGAAAVFAFPLRIGAIRVGVLGMYRDKEGPLDTLRLGNALILADIATMLLLDAEARQADDPCPAPRRPASPRTWPPTTPRSPRPPACSPNSSGSTSSKLSRGCEHTLTPKTGGSATPRTTS